MSQARSGASSTQTVAQKGTGREIYELASSLLADMDIITALDVLHRGADVGACSFEIFPLLHSVSRIHRRDSQVQALRVMKYGGLPTDLSIFLCSHAPRQL